MKVPKVKIPVILTLFFHIQGIFIYEITIINRLIFVFLLSSILHIIHSFSYSNDVINMFSVVT